MGACEGAETGNWEAPPTHRRVTYQYTPDGLPPAKKRRWPAGEALRPDQRGETSSCLAKSASFYLNTRVQTSRRRPVCSRRRLESAVRGRLLRPPRIYTISAAVSAASCGAHDDQQHRKCDRIPVSTIPSTTSLSCTDDSTTPSDSSNQEFKPGQARPFLLSEDQLIQPRYVQQAQPRIVSAWPLACELAYRHLQSIMTSNDRARPTASAASDPDPTAGRYATGGEFPFLCLLQGPSGLSIPDVVNPTQAATWLQSATALLPVSGKTAVLTCRRPPALT